MTRRRSAQPTAKALARRKPGVHTSFYAPMLPSAGNYSKLHGADVRRVAARANVMSPVTQARREFLRTIERVAPKVLRALTTVECFVGVVDERALAAWATKYRIDAPWMRVAAENTLKLWDVHEASRGKRFDLNLTNKGLQVPRPGRLPGRPEELLIRADWFEWFVRHRVLRQPYPVSALETRRKAIQALARILGL